MTIPNQRFADAATIAHYPLPIAGGIEFEPLADSSWQVSLPLGRLDAGLMLTPSFSSPTDPDIRHQFVLETPQHDYPLRPIPARRTDDGAKPLDESTVRTALDCAHILKSVPEARLRLRLEGHRPPERYLLTVSVRPTELTPDTSVRLPSLRAARPDARSQMLSNPRIAARICSPVSVAMVIRAFQPAASVDAVVRACHDPVTGMYGLWPLAIRAATLHGLSAAVELFSDWQPVLTCLAAGFPVVASIRYGAGELPGAPQNASGGHLVVVHGTEEDQVLVHDPAAPNHGSVPRRYPVNAFTRAWFRHRGAAYILTP